MKKRRIREAAQIAILAFSCYSGFFIAYIFLWFACGLPETEWAFLPTHLLAAISVYGLAKWIYDNPVDLGD